MTKKKKNHPTIDTSYETRHEHLSWMDLDGSEGTCHVISTDGGKTWDIRCKCTEAGLEQAPKVAQIVVSRASQFNERVKELRRTGVITQ